jgi:hypothetical protein
MRPAYTRPTSVKRFAQKGLLIIPFDSFGTDWGRDEAVPGHILLKTCTFREIGTISRLAHGTKIRTLRRCLTLTHSLQRGVGMDSMNGRDGSVALPAAGYNYGGN